ncbi:unnamed protein product [Notodromas monacha]|uniref:Uncharacterized protein n=1 Tax=Notodromas monacha TaxID=399045 RepID=A0A7R9GF22_9CRUS|nr:unnamed protein product [Notodromas monacha]CAG0920352.1 unnamed protein product [Notodromas monacha]
MSGAGTGSGEGSANGLNMLLWFLVLIFLGFWVASFCAGWYILISPCTVCVEGFTPLSDTLLKGVKLPHFCATHMMQGSNLGELGNACK